MLTYLLLTLQKSITHFFPFLRYWFCLAIKNRSNITTATVYSLYCDTNLEAFILQTKAWHLGALVVKFCGQFLYLALGVMVYTLQQRFKLLQTPACTKIHRISGNHWDSLKNTDNTKMPYYLEMFSKLLKKGNFENS